jgi:hypothetical protein
MKGAARDARGRGNEPRKVDETRARERDRPMPPAQAQQRGSRRPKWAVPLALLGVLGIALAVILGTANRGRTQLPADLNQSRAYSGTANSLLNPQALQSGAFGNALMTNVPVTGQQTIQVLDTEGDNARVLDERTLMSGGIQIGGVSNTFAVNRQSLEPATNAPGNWNAAQAQGLTVGFPAGVDRRDYSGWVSDTQTTTPLRFLREESRGGVNTFVYQSEVAPTPIRDPSVLGSLPTNMTRAQLAGIAPSLPVPAEQRALLIQAIPGLPEQVPVNYTFQGTTTFWVEPTTGQVIDSQRSVVRSGAISGPGGATLANLPVYNVETRYTDDAVAAAGREAADRRDNINTTGRVWPWVLGILGALALLAGLLGLLARRRSALAPAGQPTARPTDRTPGTTYRAGEARPADTGKAGRKADEMDTRKAGQPQAPYSGATPHTGAYRESPTAQPPGNEEEQHPTRGQSGQGKQPPQK